jgi:carbon monoxide dehydrogenase subunit G
MASIRKEILLDAPPDAVWAAVRDVGAVHRRLAPGFVVKTEFDGGARTVTFANGLIVRELIVDIDVPARRVAYAAVGGRSTHHNASMQVFDDTGGRSRLVWIADFLPNEVAVAVGAMMDQGADVIRRTFGSRPFVEP